MIVWRIAVEHKVEANSVEESEVLKLRFRHEIERGKEELVAITV